MVLHGETVSVDLAIRSDPLGTDAPQPPTGHREGARQGYVARVDPGFDRFGEFKRIYRATMARRSAAAFYLFDDAYFDRLRDALGDRLHLVVVEKNEVVAAAGLFVETDGIVQYHLGAPTRSPSRGAVEAADPRGLLLGGEARQPHVHLGGGVGGAADSLLYFKARVSPLRHPFRTLRVVLDEAEYRRLVASREPARAGTNPAATSRPIAWSDAALPFGRVRNAVAFSPPGGSRRDGPPRPEVRELGPLGQDCPRLGAVRTASTASTTSMPGAANYSAPRPSRRDRSP